LRGTKQANSVLLTLIDAIFAPTEEKHSKMGPEHARTYVLGIDTKEGFLATNVKILKENKF
jgi:hypothetical protein